MCFEYNFRFSVQLTKVSITCESSISPTSLISLNGETDLTIAQSSFRNCGADSDGGVIQSTGPVTVAISDSKFENSRAVGNGGAVALNGGNLYLSASVFTNCSATETGGALSAVGSRCTISNSIFKSCTSIGGGGAIVLSGGMSTINDTILQECSSEKDGGGIMQFDGADSNISNSIFTSLSSGGYGGAVTLVGGTLHIFRSSFLSCRSYVGGGAIFASQPQCYGNIASEKTALSLEGLTFDECTSDGNGGAVFFTSANTNIRAQGCNFKNCRSESSGGALSATTGAKLTLFGSFFYNNSCSDVGGSISSDNSVISVQSSTFLNSRAMRSGGAVSVASASTGTVVNSSFIQNVAFGSGGGAVYCQSSNLNLQNSSGTSNSAPAGGGGYLYWEGSLEPMLPMFNTTAQPSTILLRNSAFENCEIVNKAAYGNCLASSGKYLALSGVTKNGAVGYPGISFSVSVIEKDAYNQSIVTDSSSVLFTQTARGSNVNVVDSLVSVSGKTITQLQMGTAEFSISVKPTFSQVLWFPYNNSGLAVLASQPFIYFYGTDVETMLPVSSAAFAVVFDEGNKVCPPGYVLTLDTAEAAGLRGGICTQCLVGKYSVNPLAGINMGKPACLDCPAGGTCRGGIEVTFLIGDWVVDGGMYRLLSCPPGYQLFNMIGGQFSQDVQQCIACSKDQYIINPNSSAFSCQTCPSGASCDGSNLFGLVPGSVWVVDIATGRYVLTSCPPGYEIARQAQECSFCAPGYYCLGGAETAQPCPLGYFSKKGANSSSSCTPTSLISMVVSLPMSKGNFTSEVENKFVTALSWTADVATDSIVVNSVNEQRRSKSASILIDCQIAAKDLGSASTIAEKLQSAALNQYLAIEGLPPGSVVSIATTSATTNNGVAQYILIIVVLVGCLILIVIVAVIFFFTRRVESGEERALQDSMKAMRARLEITPSNGFLLSTESALTTNFCALRLPWLKDTSEVTIIQKSYLEAVSRLALMQVYFGNQSYCICINVVTPCACYRNMTAISLMRSVYAWSALGAIQKNRMLHSVHGYWS